MTSWSGTIRNHLAETLPLEPAASARAVRAAETACRSELGLGEEDGAGEGAWEGGVADGAPNLPNAEARGPVEDVH